MEERIALDVGHRHGAEASGFADDAHRVDAHRLDIDAPELSDAETAEVIEIMDALERLRVAEHRLSAAFQSAIGVSEGDLRALEFLDIGQRRGEIMTPSRLAGHLGISAASTTKLLNRLEAGGHVVRSMHPHDRRALRLDVTAATQALMLRAAGREEARRFTAAMGLSSRDRRAVVAFLGSLTRDAERA